MATAAKHTWISEADYLEGEKISDIKHEYVDGQVYAMAGASKRHNRISLNCVQALSANAPNTCEIYASDIKVRVTKHSSYFYPDVVVSCEPDDEDDYFLEKPCLIVEVLSKSTQHRDRGDKLLAYMNIPSLKAYLIVDQDSIEVQLFYRQSDGDWWVKTFNELNDQLDLPCTNSPIKLLDVYKSLEKTGKALT